LNFKTTQENFWAGQFGDEYIKRNDSESLQFSKVALWSQMLRSANSVNSALELGCNIGLNLVALSKLSPKMKLIGYEINSKAVQRAREYQVASIHEGSILDKINTEMCDLTFTAGVLIHINPKYLDNVYENLVTNSGRYVLVAEYYSPDPTVITYRGEQDKLFKRDFAGDLIDRYGMKLVDYGFLYKRDNWAPQDDITWFLLEK
jgi:pseudaminic acid biosynthesis-associated methylase|tara:strand:- start:6086 stop:6697 length:612 start_codon:yes stop_codon:yes gene_type:complete